ncbi:hypothetical protein [Burkholderia stabilis]|uniref:hypothetical protein n=1 Tax=Burkholderia stabilis TaxID=95485 RepID=UPI0010126982|nr:hypothetical protein [Burkholderia stabilis]
MMNNIKYLAMIILIGLSGQFVLAQESQVPSESSDAIFAIRMVIDNNNLRDEDFFSKAMKLNLVLMGKGEGVYNLYACTILPTTGPKGLIEKFVFRDTPDFIDDSRNGNGVCEFNYIKKINEDGSMATKASIQFSKKICIKSNDLIAALPKAMVVRLPNGYSVKRDGGSGVVDFSFAVHDLSDCVPGIILSQ